MALTPLKSRPAFENDPKLTKAAHNLSTLLEAAEKKKIPLAQVRKINEIMAAINSHRGTDSELTKQIKSAQVAIIKLLEQELKIAPKNHYQLQWLVLGMATFGIPLGLAIGMALGNIAFMGIGLPIGMAIGVGVGSIKDKKTLEEGRQLDWIAT